MRVTCPFCQTKYNIDDKRVPPGGAKLKCAKCKSLFPIKAAEHSAGEVAATERATDGASGAIPLPGLGQETTPLPASTLFSSAASAIRIPAAAIPLPGSAPKGSAESAIPLPDSLLKSSVPSAIPLPGLPVKPSSAGAIPLPGGAPRSSAESAIPLPD
ncbi:MAG TPA: zinc-ribbon domain-containing protein, partial [Myxococcaceae bacterium]|nr:zinc-ribbon domain-containing protein [Myxococcaceae bacterium]